MSDYPKDDADWPGAKAKAMLKKWNESVDPIYSISTEHMAHLIELDAAKTEKIRMLEAAIAEALKLVEPDQFSQLAKKPISTALKIAKVLNGEKP